MNRAIRGINLKFGKSGIAYSILHVCMLGPIATIGLFLYVVVYGGVQFWEQLLFISLAFFVGHLLLSGIKGLKVSKDTVHKIEIIDSKIRLNTFGGKKLFLFPHQFDVDIDSECILDHKYVHIIFPQGEEHLILTYRNNQMYISSVTTNFKELKEALLIKNENI